MTAANPALSKARFIARVNGFCRQAWVTIRHDFGAYRSAQDPSLGPRRRFKEAIARSLLPDVDRLIFAKIRALGAPRGEKSEIEAIAALLQESVEIGERSFPITSPKLLWELFDTFDPTIRQYGLGDCLVNTTHTGISG